MKDEFIIRVPLSKDKGFIGRSCINRNCNRYFKIHKESIKEYMYCPYCSHKYHYSQLHTKGQIYYAAESAIQKSIESIFDEKRRRTQGYNGEFVKYKPRSYKPKQVIPSY